MNLLWTLRRALRRKPRFPGKFQDVAMAIQLDVCCGFLVNSAGPEQKPGRFWGELIHRVACLRRNQVWGQLQLFNDMTGTDLKIFATMCLDAAWNGHADLIRGLCYAMPVGELARQASATMQSLASPLPPEQDWAACCAEIASYLEQGRHGFLQALRAMPQLH